MGLLVPEDFPMSLLANDEERLVVQALRDRLTDGWLVIPDVGLTEARDRQMDIVLAHALLYVGVSRAIAGLTVVGPRAIAERLRLEDRSAPQPSL